MGERARERERGRRTREMREQNDNEGKKIVTQKQLNMEIITA